MEKFKWAVIHALIAAAAVGAVSLAKASMDIDFGPYTPYVMALAGAVLKYGSSFVPGL